MADYSNKTNIYPGANYGFNPSYGLNDDYGTFLGMGYRSPTAQFGLSTDPRTANQIEMVSKKMNTGAKVIEVQGVQTNVLENIPKQHFSEINRLKKLTGAELTFHGPLVEPTGIVTREGWNEEHRKQAERQMWHAVERSHDLDPDGNIVVTFHSSNIPLSDLTVKSDEGKIVPTQTFYIDERTGQFQPISLPKTDFFKGEEVQPSIKEDLEKHNKEAWFKALQALSYHAHIGVREVGQALTVKTDNDVPTDELLKFYKKYLENSAEAQELMKKAGPYEEDIREKMTDLVHGDLYLRDAYNDLQKLYNQAFGAAKNSYNRAKTEEERNAAEENLTKLSEFRDKIKSEIGEIEDPTRLSDFGKTIIEGVNTLRQVKPPKILTPFRDFAVDKASDTFSNLAFDAYKKFGHGQEKDTTPIISIENPPAGTAALDKAEDLRDLVDEARRKFAQRATQQLGMSEKDAKKQAEKLIGVTWDVGHINMIRKFGYDEDDVVKQSKEIAPYVKHVHLSDNFGLEHTELPMGMGNVPMKKIMDLHEGYRKAKKIIETGSWFGPQAFGARTPFLETLQAFGSPIYGMKMSPYWNQSEALSNRGYWSGFGMNPDVHHRTFGGGLTGDIPTDLGGRSRVSGAPME
jgi:hypothetical protein